MPRKVSGCLSDVWRTGRRRVQHSFSYVPQRQHVKTNKGKATNESGYLRGKDESDDEGWTTASATVEQMRGTNQEESYDDGFENLSSSIEEMRETISAGAVSKIPSLHDLSSTKAINWRLSEEEIEFEPRVFSTPKKKAKIQREGYSSISNFSGDRTFMITTSKTLEVICKETEEFEYNREFHDVHLSEAWEITNVKEQGISKTDNTLHASQNDLIGTRKINDLSNILPQDGIEDDQVEKEEQAEISRCIKTKSLGKYNEDDQCEPDLKDKELSFSREVIKRKGRKLKKAERKKEKITYSDQKASKVSKNTPLEKYRRKMSQVSVCDIITTKCSFHLQ